MQCQLSLGQWQSTCSSSYSRRTRHEDSSLNLKIKRQYLHNTFWDNHNCLWLWFLSSRSGSTEFWATWSKGRCPYPWQVWNEMVFKIPSHPDHSMTPWSPCDTLMLLYLFRSKILHELRCCGCTLNLIFRPVIKMKVAYWNGNRDNLPWTVFPFQERRCLSEYVKPAE